MWKLYIAIFLGAGLMACSSFHTSAVKIHSLKVDQQDTTDEATDLFIRPYRDTLQAEMGLVIANSLIDMVIGRPSSALGNWVADAVFVDQTRNVRLKQPVFCLLNTGGIRSTINKGEVTLGDMYRLMPFDNEIVWVELPASSIRAMEEYLKKTTGEPIANAKVENGRLMINGWRDTTTRFWVITSDYLSNGGDKMTFFTEAFTKNSTGRLMRDALIEIAKEQGTIQIDSTNRIQW